MPTVKIPQRRATGRLPEIRVINPGKGLNNFEANQLIQDQEGADMINVQFTESGCVAKAPGYSAVGTGLTNNPKGLGALVTSSVRQILTMDGTALKYLNGSTWTGLAGASFTSGQEVNFCQCRNAIYIWNGAEAGAKYDGTTLSRPTTTISAAFAIFYSGYQIASGVTTQPNRVYISSLTNADDFTDTTDDSTSHPGATAFSGTDSNYVDINAGDGDKVTGFGKFQNALVIFKERSIYQLTFDSSGNPTVSLITSVRGAVGHKAIDNVDNDVFFLSRQGVFVLGNEPNYYTAIRTNELSARVGPIIDTINVSNLSKAAALYTQDVYYLGIASGGTTTNNRVLTYDKRYLAWSYWNHIAPNSWLEFVDSTNTRHLYFASDSEAQVHEVTPTTYSANGSAISSYWLSKAFDAGLFEVNKRYIDISFLFRQIVGTVTITIYADNGSIVKTSAITSTTSATGSMGTSMFGSQLWGGTGSAPSGTSTNNVPYRLKINRKARNLQIKISNSALNQTFTLLAFNITYRPYSHYNFNSLYKIY